MTRKLKALGISLVAVFALSALGASSASAVDVITTQGGVPAIATGVGHDHVFKLTNASGEVISKFECTTSKFAATVKNGDSSITADILYQGTLNETPHEMEDCNSTIGQVLVTTTGCDYNLTGTTTNGDAPVWIVCETGKVITIRSTDTGVTITIPAQTPTAGGVHYTNEAGGKVKVSATVTGVTFNCHTSTFLCTLAGIPHHGNNTDYTGNVVMSGFGDTQWPTPVTEGGTVSLESS